MQPAKFAKYLIAMICLFAPGLAVGQDSTSTRPVVGLRKAKPSPVLLTGAEVVTEPGADPIVMSILVDGTGIKAVGSDLEVPAGTKRHDFSGKRIYAGLIDAMHEVDPPTDPPNSGPGYWNSNVTPEYQAAWSRDKASANFKKLRSQGITAQLLAPKGGILKGDSCVVLLKDKNPADALIRNHVFQHATLTVPRGSRRNAYPNSPMGAVALLRQALYDAKWYQDVGVAYENHPRLPRPEPNHALERLSEAMVAGTFVVDADNERMAIRAAAIADEFSLRIVLRGSGREYRELDQITAMGRPVLLPVNFPDTPRAKTQQNLRDVPLRDWMHWHFAPENPSRLDDEGIAFCLTTDKLSDPAKFLKQVRRAVKRGLEAETALASLTTTPAKLLGIETQVGKVAPGMLANLVVASGDLFDGSTKVLETWVGGQRHVVEQPTKDDPIVGQWEGSLPGSNESLDVLMTVQQKGKKLSAKLSVEEEAPPSVSNDEDEEDAPESKEPQSSDQGDSEEDKDQDKKEGEGQAKTRSASFAQIVRERSRMSASVKLQSLSDAYSSGGSRLSLLTVSGRSDDEGTNQNRLAALHGTLTMPDGSTHLVEFHRAEVKNEDEDSEAVKKSAELPETKAAEETKQEVVKETNQEKEAQDSDTKDDSDTSVAASTDSGNDIQLVYPLGAYGVDRSSEPPETVLFRGGTVWTCGELGKLESADVLVQGGKIVAVGVGLEQPEGCHVVDVAGKHLSPGLIDCHSHMATDGGVNESGQTITAQVRIGDFIDNTDITIYRQLAGGVTSANILHGSANPIGGQNQVIKLRWGGTMDELKFQDAPLGIKFALGENVKRRTSRYPTSRMGVEQILRDTFFAARTYAAKRQAWEKGDRSELPPRRDLQLDAVVEILRGDRWIHCHSYRQDEILATLDVLDEFHVRIGTLQHILEGYKVADRMAEHGAMASTFSDWWAYKLEVYDAIPYNGVLMHQADVVVSYNSDDAEMGRHLNTEAAKATKYGGVPEQEALKFVTLNPAKQLRIEDRVGSIEVGKDADLVVWSGRPLSTTTRCEQTWIDGQVYFDLDADQKLRQRDLRMKHQLIQMATSQPKSTKPSSKKSAPKTEEERWTRVDQYCQTGKNQEEVNLEQQQQQQQQTAGEQK